MITRTVKVTSIENDRNETSARSKKFLIDAPIIEEAGEMIRRGELVAFPTETVYGLGANGLDPIARKKIFEVKARPNDKPLSLLVSSVEMIDRLALINSTAASLIEKFFPGPLTLILSARSNGTNGSIGSNGSSGTIGVRMPNHPIALALIDAAGVPIAAPSANLSGNPSPRTAQEVLNDLDGRIPLVLDGGACSIGIASTVVDVSTEQIKILRAGSLAAHEILRGESNE